MKWNKNKGDSFYFESYRQTEEIRALTFLGYYQDNLLVTAVFRAFLTRHNDAGLVGRGPAEQMARTPTAIKLNRRIKEEAGWTCTLQETSLIIPCYLITLAKQP